MQEWAPEHLPSFEHLREVTLAAVAVLLIHMESAASCKLSRSPPERVSIRQSHACAPVSSSSATRARRVAAPASRLAERLTVNVGFSYLTPSPDKGWQILTVQADQALYHAKLRGLACALAYVEPAQLLASIST